MTVATKIIVPDTPAHYDGIKRSFDEMGLQAQPVTVHTSAGPVQAFRLSMAACILLATIKLINPN